MRGRRRIGRRQQETQWLIVLLAGLGVGLQALDAMLDGRLDKVLLWASGTFTIAALSLRLETIKPSRGR